MAFRSLFTKGIALTSAGRTGKHSRKASSLARQAMNCFRQARSLKGDKKIASIAAASIVAKVSRDFHMKSLNIRFPGYGWEKNVGYGVEQHKAAINKLGINTEHRRSFRPIYNMLCL